MSCIHKTHVKFPIEYISVIKPEIPKTPEAFGKDPFRQTPGNAFLFSSNKKGDLDEEDRMRYLENGIGLSRSIEENVENRCRDLETYP